MAAYDEVKEEETRLGRWRSARAAWLWLSLVGGVMLSWWEVKYQPTNQQQWMVPLGLILFLTPLFVCFSLLVSDFCNPIPPQKPAPER